MRNKLFRMRRLGVAVLGGTLLLGAVSIIGAGPAAAAATTATAALTGTAAATNLYPTATAAQAVAPVTLTLSATAVATDEIVLTLPCSSSLFFGAAGTAAGFGSTSTNVLSKGPACAVNDVDTFTSAGTGQTASVAITGVEVTTSGASAGAVAPAGLYESTGGTTSFTVPTVGNVVDSVTMDTPAVTLAESVSSQALSNIVITEPVLDWVPAAGYICVVPSGVTGAVFANSGTTGSSAPTISVLPSADETLPSPPVITDTASLLVFQVGTEIQATTYTIGNLLGASSTHTGAVTFTVSVGSNATCSTGTAALAATTGFAVLPTITTSQPYQGTLPDDTVADEFLAANPNGVTNVVLATDSEPWDALSAAWLEGMLNTGLLITPTNSLDASMLQALRFADVANVYVVGGPLAVSAADITALKATPAYSTHGTVLTGSDLNVIGPIYGTTADDTAQAIDTYFGDAASAASTNLVPAYASATLYNDTTGTATVSTSAPTTALKTAFLVSDSDFADAMSIAGASWLSHIPIILTPTASLGTQAAAVISALSIKQVVILGGPLAISNAVVTSLTALGVDSIRVAGTDETDTAGMIVKFELGSANAGLGYALNTKGQVFASRGDYWSDALGEAQLGGMGGTAAFIPMVLAENPTTVGTYTTALLNQGGNEVSSPVGINGNLFDSVIALGGPLAIAAATLAAMATDISVG